MRSGKWLSAALVVWLLGMSLAFAQEEAAPVDSVSAEAAGGDLIDVVAIFVAAATVVGIGLVSLMLAAVKREKTPMFGAPTSSGNEQ